MTNPDFIERQKRIVAFSKTEIGRAYLKMLRATESYWVLDGNPNVTSSRLTVADTAMRDAQREFLDLLMEREGI